MLNVRTLFQLQVEAIGQRILEDLEEAETRWRTSSPVHRLRVAKAKQDEKMAQKKAKAAESASKSKRDQDDEAGPGDDQDDVGESMFDPDAPSEEFSFVGKGISHVEFKREVDDLSWLGLDPCQLMRSAKLRLHTSFR